uniref:Uncharacterized protein n=1 Tax=Caenorhabditis japonica TaxID=281687 RepID=A0A8R1EHC7_CAEJA
MTRSLTIKNIPFSEACSHPKWEKKKNSSHHMSIRIEIKTTRRFVLIVSPTERCYIIHRNRREGKRFVM